MEEELATLAQNETWKFVPRQPSMDIVGSHWVFKFKLKEDGTLDRLKARFVAKVYLQIDGVDFFKTYSPIAKPSTERLVISIAMIKRWNIQRLDVKNAFLH